jgi:hypothetical protein
MAKPSAAAPAPDPSEEAASLPQLEQLLTAEQQAEYNSVIDRSIEKAQRSIARLNGRHLNPGQNTSMERIKAFIVQALDARKTDLVRAKNLAERADVLAEDLLRSAQ